MPVIYDNLQYIFACLTTHPRILKNIIADFNRIHEYFKLSLADEATLKNFFQHQAHKILTTSLLLEEKRWREILLAMPYISKLIEEEHLTHYWKNYLDTFKTIGSIPETPLAESIQFLDYLLEQYKHNFFMYQMIQYELIRNRTIAYKFEMDQADKIHTIQLCQSNFNSYQIVPNPSLSIKKFDLSILNCIAKLQANYLIEESEKIMTNKNQDLLFIKDRKNGVFKIIKLAARAELFLKKIIASSALWSEEIKKDNESIDTYIYFIKELLSHDVISIVNKN